MPFLFERSARFEPGRLESRRALLSIPCHILNESCADPQNEVLQICRRMSSPESHQTSIARFFPSASCIHFGFEASQADRIGKCYLELPQQHATGDQLVFLGFKWSLGGNGVAVVSRYRSVPAGSPRRLRDQFLQAVPDTLASPAERFLDQLVPLSLTSTELARLRLLEVTEEGSDRRSLDLNVYERNVILQSIESEITGIAEALQISTAQREEWWEHVKTSRIGHISLGVSRNRAPFMTLYHAADAQHTTIY